MSAEIIVAILGAFGTIVGSFFGVIASSKLTQYRIQKLEEQVNKHNNIIERVFRLEENVEIHDRDIEQLKRQNGLK